MCIRDSRMPAVDLALTPFPERDDQRAAVQRLLDGALTSEICVIERQGGAEVEYYLENVAAGHAFPSGATLDREVWVELIAEADGSPVYTSGVVADDQPLKSLDDPDLWRLGSKGFDENGNETHDFWEVHRLESELLPAPCLLYTSPSPRDRTRSRMPSSA